jgi:hypothetical protein
VRRIWGGLFFDLGELSWIESAASYKRDPDHNISGRILTPIWPVTSDTVPHFVAVVPLKDRGAEMRTDGNQEGVTDPGEVEGNPVYRTSGADLDTLEGKKDVLREKILRERVDVVKKAGPLAEKAVNLVCLEDVDIRPDRIAHLKRGLDALLEYLAEPVGNN